MVANNYVELIMTNLEKIRIVLKEMEQLLYRTLMNFNKPLLKHSKLPWVKLMKIFRLFNQISWRKLHKSIFLKI
jgi:hypothetical protein